MKRAIRLLSFSLLTASPSFAGAVRLITINSSSLPSGTSGSIDLAFNGGFPAIATIGNFSLTGGSLVSGSVTTQGTVSGTLPGTVTLQKDNSRNPGRHDRRRLHAVILQLEFHGWTSDRQRQRLLDRAVPDGYNGKSHADCKPQSIRRPELCHDHSRSGAVDDCPDLDSITDRRHGDSSAV